MNGGEILDLLAFQDDSPDANIEDLAMWIALEERVLEKMKKEHSERKDKLDATKETVAKLLKAKGLKSIKLNSGLSPCRIVTTKYYLKPETEQEAVCNWFIKNGLGDMVKRSVNFNTMQSALKERQEAGLPIPDALVDLTERDSLRLNNKSAYLSEQNITFKATEVRLQGGKIEVI